MPRTGIDLPDCWGLDCNTKLDAASAARLAAASIVGGGPVRFVWRYVSLHQPVEADITQGESAAILGAGLGLLLVQHPRLPGWTASGPLGQADAAAAVHHAQSVGYQIGCALCLDLEGVGNIGESVIEFCTEWATAVRKAGYSPILYVGFQCGLTPAQLGALPFDAFWSDFGPRVVIGRGFACKQRVQTTLAGVIIDPDYASADETGRRMRAMVDTDTFAVADATTPSPPDPAAGGQADPAA